MFRTIDNIATGSNTEDRVKKLEAQVTELKKTVEDQQKRIEDLEKWPGTGDEAILKMFQGAGAEGAEAQDAEAEDQL